MSLPIEQALLDTLWAALQDPLQRCFVHSELERVARMVSAQWVDRIDIGDLLEDWDQRTRGIEIFAFARALDLAPRTVFNIHGRSSQRTFMGSDKFDRADAAALIIGFERFGFRVDPSVFVAAVLPTLKGARQATIGELTVLQWNKERHKSAPLSFMRAGSDGMWAKTKSLKTVAGYRVKAYLADDGKPLILEVASPRFRRQPEPVLTKCPDCSMSYMKGDPEESAAHRREHRKYMTVAEPRPHPKVLAAVAEGWSGRVDQKSPQWMHSEVYGRARLFKREFRYDFIQWSSAGEREPGIVGFLFLDPTGSGTIQGACCFRWRDYTDEPHAWGMTWIWTAPVARRKGLLKARWPAFLQEFGAFHIEHPLSDAMKAFTEKYALAGQVA